MSKATIISSSILLLDANDDQAIVLGKDILGRVGHDAPLIIIDVIKVPRDGLIHMLDVTIEMNRASKVGHDLLLRQRCFANAFSHTLRILKEVWIGNVTMTSLTIPTTIRIMNALDTIFVLLLAIALCGNLLDSVVSGDDEHLGLPGQDHGSDGFLRSGNNDVKEP